MEEWLRERGVTEVECLVPDLTGISRGKILPAEKFIKSLHDDSLRLPEQIFVQTVNGEWLRADEDPTHPTIPDIYLRPDASSLRMVPWYEEPTAQVINDCFHADGSPVDMAPRQVLRRVLDLYEARGWRPVVAPELEFFLVAVNTEYRERWDFSHRKSGFEH